MTRPHASLQIVSMKPKEPTARRQPRDGAILAAAWVVASWGGRPSPPNLPTYPPTSPPPAGGNHFYYNLVVSSLSPSSVLPLTV